MSAAHCESHRTCAVVLNWNQPAMTLDCVRSLLAQTVPLGVLVVDNGSTAANRVALRAGLPAGCEYLQNATNLGFAGGMNVGIRAALRNRAEYVWLVNNDAFPDPDCLAQLDRAMTSDPSLAAVTPALVYPDGRPQLIGGRVDWQSGRLGWLQSGEIPYPTRVGEYATGAALMVRTCALRRVGALDARFFAYWEEVDLCARFVRVGRWNVADVPAARCVHLERGSTGGGTSPLAAYLLTRNTFLFLRKHLPVRWLIPALCRAMASSLRHVAGVRKSDPQTADAILCGLWDAARGRYGRPARLVAPGWLARAVGSQWWRAERLLSRFADRIGPRTAGPARFAPTEPGASI